MNQLAEFPHVKPAHAKRLASQIEKTLGYYALNLKDQQVLPDEQQFSTSKLKFWIENDNVIPEDQRLHFSNLLNAACFRAAQINKR